MKAEALPQGWSEQRSELWALAKVLRHAKGRQVNIYTDSRHAFATLHVHGAIYKERGLLMWGVGGKEIKNKKEILQMLEAIWKPPQVAVSIVKAISKELIQSAKEIGWLTRQPRRWRPNQAPQWAPSQSLRSSWHKNCLHP